MDTIGIGFVLTVVLNLTLGIKVIVSVLVAFFFVSIQGGNLVRVRR